MLINKKKIYNSRFTRFKKLFFIFSFLSYTFLLITISINKDILVKRIDSNISLTTKQIIKDSFLYQFYQSGFKANVLNNMLKAFLQKVDPIKLDIKYKQYEKLQKKRNEAIKKGVLITSKDDYVKAILTDGQLKLNGKIRLKGDLVDHLSSNKWSYRVKLKDENTFLGMNKFSLQSPVTRNYLWEWKYHTFLKDEGLPALRYKFRPLIINNNKEIKTSIIERILNLL